MSRHCSKSERKQKGQYIEQLKQFMREYGYGELCKRVIKSLNTMVFDGFIFLSEEHRNSFWRMYNIWIKHTDKRENSKISVIYLLSSEIVFNTVLINYASNPLFSLPNSIKKCAGEEQYTLYQAAKLFAGMKSGLSDSDLFEEGVIDDQVRSVIMNAKFIQRYGIYGYMEKRNPTNKSGYINNSASHNRKHDTYVYNGKSIKIRK